VSKFLYGGVIPSDWQVAWIPIHTLIPHPVQGPFVFHGIGMEATTSGTVWLDEVKVVEKLRWMLPEVARYVTHGFGVIWFGDNRVVPDEDKKRHLGADYRSGNKGYGEAGIPVVAAHDGKIVSTHINSGNWGCTVVIQSKGNAFTTTYIHLKEYLATGTCGQPGSLVSVRASEIIGETAWLDSPSAPHLHFGLRMKPYTQSEEQDAWKGALYPYEMPEAFVDPELIDWQ